MSFLLTLHSVLRWAVLVALVLAAVIAAVQAARRASWSGRSDRPFALATVVFDIQLAVGVIVWIATQAWNSTMFFFVIHPLLMIGAAGLAHGSHSAARRRSDTSSFRILAVGFVAVVVVVFAAIPWQR